MLIEAPAPSVERVPFSPPTGQPLHYRITRKFEGDGAPPASVVEQMLTFTPDEVDGWQLKIETPSISTGGTTFTATSNLAQVLLQDDAVLLHAPMTIILRSNGSLLRVAEWQTYGQGLVKLPMILPPGSGAGDAQLRTMMKKAMLDGMRQFVAGPAENAASIATPWNNLLGYGALEYTPGSPREWSDMKTFMNGEAVVTVDGKVTFTPQADGTIMMETETTTSPEGFAEAVDTARSRGNPEGLRQAAEVQRNGLWMNDYDSIFQSSVVLDSQGVIRSATVTQRTERRGQVAARQIVELERVEPETAVPATPAPAIVPTSVPTPVLAPVLAPVSAVH